MVSAPQSAYLDSGGLAPLGPAVEPPSAAPPNFDGLARAYRWLEYMSFGPLLSRCRGQYLSYISKARRVLVLGDGDGRFLAQLLRSNPLAIVDAVDSSAGMLRELKNRISVSKDRVTLYHSDALKFADSLSSAKTRCGATMKTPAYDLVITHFFLDCFSVAELQRLIGAIQPHLAAETLWVVSEFAVPSSRVGGWLSRSLIGALYRVFGLFTCLKTRKLPDHAGVLARAGFVRLSYRARVSGLLVSELWSRSAI